MKGNHSSIPLPLLRILKVDSTSPHGRVRVIKSPTRDKSLYLGFLTSKDDRLPPIKGIGHDNDNVSALMSPFTLTLSTWKRFFDQARSGSRWLKSSKASKQTGKVCLGFTFFSRK